MELTPINKLSNKKQLMNEFKELEKLLKVDFINLSAGERNHLMARIRRLNNRIVELAKTFAGSKEINREIERLYNRTLRSLQDITKGEFSFDKFRDYSEKGLAKLKNDFVNSIRDALEVNYVSRQQQVEFINNLDIAILKEDVKLFNPRLVLFQMPSYTSTVITATARKEFRLRYAHNREFIENEVHNLLNDDETDYAQARKRIREKLKNAFPDGKVTFPVQSAKGLTHRSISLTKYAEMWTTDISTIQNSKMIVGMQKESKWDLVQFINQANACEKCRPLAGTYSLSGNSKKYRKLPATPPVHPNCSCYLLPAQENF